MKKKAKTYLGKEKNLIENMQKHLSYRNYSKYTFENYVKEINHLCCYFQCSPKNISEQQIENYLYYLATKKQLGSNKII